MAQIVFLTASVKMGPNVIPRKGHVSAQKVGQGHIAAYRVHLGHLARAAFITALVNPAMLRNLVI